MSMTSTFKSATIAASALGVAALLAVSPVEAREGRHGAFAAGAAAGVLGGALLGSQINRQDRAEPETVYEEPQTCRIERQRIYADNGDVIIRRVRVCR